MRAFQFFRTLVDDGGSCVDIHVRVSPSLSASTPNLPPPTGLAHLGNPPDILPPVLFAETQILIQAEADVVAIESVGGQAVVEEVLLERDGDSGFAAGREAGEPEREAFLLAEGGALEVRHR